MSLGKEWRTFNAVFRRNLRLFTSYSTWLIATIIWPIPLLAMNIYQYLGVASSRSVSTTLSQNYGLTLSGMIIVGTVVYLLYNRLLWSTGNSLQTERWMGTIDVLFLTPASRLTMLLANGLSSLVEGAWWIVAIFLLNWFIFGIQLTVTSWPAVAITLVSTMIALVAVGVFFASFFILSRAADQMASSLQAPIRFFSGVAFPVAALPQALQFVSLVIPVTFAISALRATLLSGGGIVDILNQLLPLYLFTAVFLFVGYFLLRIVEKRAKKDGSLYQM
ncbi:ABC transporter permease [Candidatus Bathyarchaeota archaeon]|nr:MAG: ABC transporter permease [Candidatus Bathyarchaeota archaeon]TMI33503.1 MAG: ABC transporter permease [Candidatus Bathyarchaeota archaeon]